MNSHLTAIARKTLPVPHRWLLKNHYLYGHVLDYGCGRCKEINDRELIKYPLIKSVTSYDPHYEPLAFSVCDLNKWDCILCTYVLCTIPKKDEAGLLRYIQSLLKNDGLAFITVRNDEPKKGYGKTSRGTYQRKVELKRILPLKETRNYRIYLLTKDTQIV